MSKARAPKRREENEIEFARIVAFSDGVFAIAITLLVLNLGVSAGVSGDRLAEALWGQRENLLAYALSFAVIGRFWLVHHRFFTDVVGFDGRLLALNLFYLAWIVLIPFSSQVLGDHAGETPAVVLYAANLSAVSLIGLWMTTDAQRDGLAKIDRAVARENRRRALVVAAVFLASIPVALINAQVAPWLWLIMFVDVVGRRTASASRRRQSDPDRRS